MTIYADQMFLENFIMNYVILYLTSKFSGIKSKWYRFALSSCIGALYVICSYIFNFYDTKIISLKVTLSIVMVLVAFKTVSIKKFFKIFTFFLTITFLIGGASFGLAFLFNFTMISENGVLYVEEFPVTMLILGGATSIVMVKWIKVFLKKKLNFQQLLYSIEIKLFEKKLSTIVFLDSGHNVKDTFTGYPVVIIQSDVLSKLIPGKLLESIAKNNFDFEEKWKKRLCIIPISTVNSTDDVLIGFRLDECIIHKKNGDEIIKKIVVAGCDRTLDKKGRYYGLIGNIM